MNIDNSQVIGTRKIITGVKPINTDVQDILILNNREIVHRKSFYQGIKRLMDIIISFMGLIFLSPVFLMIAIAIKIDSKGSIIFKHKRVGKEGKTIYLYKFRSMVENAEDMIKDFTPEQQKEFKENFKLENDPRVTRVGKFLRKTSLDELPQILNILKGDLSIIGPRPVITDELDKYEYNKDKFLSVTPGLTGYWAANGRSNTTYEQRMTMELYYIDNMSLKLDVKIFLKTISSVLKKEGAV